jgi:hypothetical protein
LYEDLPGASEERKHEKSFNTEDEEKLDAIIEDISGFSSEDYMT